MTACYFGNFKMIELIMNANPNLELQDIASNTAWQIAFDNSYRECVNYILAQMGKCFVFLMVNLIHNF